MESEARGCHRHRRRKVPRRIENISMRILYINERSSIERYTGKLHIVIRSTDARNTETSWIVDSHDDESTHVSRDSEFVIKRA